MWRDPWAWVCALLALAPLLRAWGAPLGEPASDDFDYLYRARFGPFDLFDGGGAVVHWRPLARQVYFAAVTPLLLSRPGLVAGLHAALLALACVLLYRTLRRQWPAPWAATAATFPALMEPARMLVAWPSAMQDLGALALSALALHQASRGRVARSLAALAGALLCKETAIVVAALLPWMPRRVDDAPPPRRRLALGALAVAAVWGVAYVAVVRRAGLHWLRELDPEGLAAPWPARLWWALGHTSGDAFGLDPASAAGPLLAGAALIVAAGIACALFRPARARLAASSPWIAWGVAWFVACAALLGETHPGWAEFRSVFAATGLGLASVALLGALWPGLPVALLALRVGLLAAAPAPSARIERAPAGPDLDFAELSRLQRFTAETRHALLARASRLPAGAAVGQHHRPLMTEHAFGGPRALRVWYGDSTLRWVRWESLSATPPADLAAVVEYEPHRPHQVVIVEPAAMLAYLEATRLLRDGNEAAALEALDRAEALQADRRASVFLGAVAGKRALARLARDPLPAAERDAITALRRWPDGGDARYVLATVLAIEGRKAEARAQIDTLLSLYPFDESARQLQEEIESGSAKEGY